MNNIDYFHSFIENKTNYIINIGRLELLQNNSFYNFINNNFKGLFSVDINLDTIEKLEKFDIYKGYITPLNVYEIFNNFNVPINFDILIINTPNYGLDTLRKILKKYRPKIMILHINEKIPPPILFEVKFKENYIWDYSHCYGFSITSGNKVLDKYGYKILSILELNFILCIDNDLYKFFELDENYNILEIYKRDYINNNNRFNILPWNENINYWLEINDDEKLYNEILNYFTQNNNRSIFENKTKILNLDFNLGIINKNQHLYFKKLINNLSINNNVNNLDFLLNNLITSFSLYFISDHYIGNELERFNIPVITNSNNILKNNNINTIKNMDILFVQNDFFNLFFDSILPQIEVKFILITGQWNLPKIDIYGKTIALLNDNRVFKWFSQNPVFKHEKYIPFPYGLNYGYDSNNPEIKRYANELLNINNDKQNNIINLPMSYSTNECRNIFRNNPIGYMDTESFYKEINNAKFILSPIGDRDETYRHWEAIGLGTIPIANVGILYKELYKDNMYYVNDTYEMLDMYNNNINLDYKCPNKDFICLEYWKDYIKNNIYI